MRSGSVRLFRIAGIDVNVHISWLVIFGLVTWSLSQEYFIPPLVPSLPEAERLTLGAAAAILLFVSVLLHELAHSFVARWRGLGAHSITLFIFGGVSTLEGDAPQASTEFLVAIVGPLMSFALAGVSYVLASAIDEARAAALLSYLFVINGLLGVFNLVPGFPLDGGRVLRSIVWTVTGSRRRGLEIAVAVGQLVSYGFMILGFVWVLSGELLNGIWFVAIGWFLQNAGSANLRAVRLEDALKGIAVRNVLRPDTASVGVNVSVENLIEEYLMPANRRVMPVTDHGRLVGMISLSDIRAVPPEARRSTTVGSIMGGHDGVVAVQPSTPVTEALKAMTDGGFEQLPVTDDGNLVGVLTHGDVIRQLQLREALRVH
ncbi:MAG TPA: site-2 protease family protein [Candidatus Limnocylindrales bacterium]|jgi:Zn-dependent protease